MPDIERNFSTENILGGNFVLPAADDSFAWARRSANYALRRYWLRFAKPVRQFMRIETDCPSRLPPSCEPSKLVTFIAFSPKIMPV
jgi:hypothetical protein